MKKSTIITIVAFALGVVILAAGFILLTDNNISKKLFSTTTTTSATTTTTRKTYEPMDLFNTTVSEYVTLGDYKNMTIETDQIEVSDEELEMQINILLAMDGEFTKEREGSISEKVFFDFDFTGYLANEDGTKGLAFSGGSSEDKGQLAYIDGDVLKTISSSGVGSFIDGFAQGILNKNVGDTFDLAITFPENYDPEMAGKKTIFEIKINYIAKLNFTDGWVKEYTKEEQKTCDEYREYLRDTINDMIKESNTSLVWEKIIENSIVEIPEQQFNYVYYSYRYQIEDYAAMFGVSYEDFLKSGYASYVLGINVSSDEALVKYVNEGLSYELLMIAIIQAEDIKVSDEEYRVMLDTLIEQTGKTEAELLEIYTEEYIRQQLALNEVGNVVYELNTFVLKTEE